MPLEFETAAPGFDLDNAYFLVKACEFAGMGPGQVLSRSVEELGLEGDSIETFDVVSEEEGHDYHGFLGANQNIVILAFRDVDAMEPWLRDAAVTQKAGFSGMVHKGFADALDAVWKEAGLERKVKELVSEDRGLWVTGHGLGGALAVLAAARLNQQGVNVREVYTFGAPRIGDTDFFYNYSVPTYRLVNNNDIFAHIPAELLPVGFHYYTYSHVGTFTYFDRHKRLSEGTSNWSEKKHLVHQQLLKMGQPPTQWFQDHFISAYVEAIHANL